MYYTKKQLLQIIQNKDLSQVSILKILQAQNHYEHDRFDYLIECLKVNYLHVSLELIKQLTDYISNNPNQFQQLRLLLPNEGEFNEIMKSIEYNLKFENSPNQQINIKEYLQKHDLNIKLAYKTAKNSQNETIVNQLNFLEKYDFNNPLETQSFLEEYLKLHHEDLDIEKDKIKDNIKLEGFDLEKNDIYQVTKPKQLYKESMDGTIDLANKKEVFIYRFKEELVEKDKIYENPYFLFTTNQNNEYFIGRQYYKQAILSYTSNFARSLRYSNSKDYQYIDLVIKDGKYQKIYMRNENLSNQISVENGINQSIKNQIDKDSGITDISNLLTENQDLIFRSSLDGIVLVEGVAGSGKTNLIFHRIDYLLQEYPDKFHKQNIGIFVKNIYLKEYMQNALENTDFGFKQDIKINIFYDRIKSCIQNHSIIKHTNWQGFEPNSDIKLFFKQISQSIRQVFIDLLNKSINKLIIEVNASLEEALSPNVNYSSTNNIMFKGIENSSNKILNTIQLELKNFKIDATISYFQNLSNFEAKIFDKIERIKNKGVISNNKIKSLEQEIENSIYNFQNTVIKDIFDDNKINLEHPLFHDIIGKIENNSLLILYLINTIFLECKSINIVDDFDYILLDEFQDFQIDELIFLNHFYNSMVWSGDLTQSTIYTDFNSLDGFTFSDRKLIQDNFRNTLQTVKFANNILQNCNIYNLDVKRVNRVGNKPQIITELTYSKLSEIINDSIKNNKKICVAYSNKNHIEQIVETLNLDNQKYYCDTEINKIFNNKYQLYLFDYKNIKGLEYENMILLDWDEMLGNGFDNKAIKHAYIGVTRAIHNLNIFVTKACLDKLNIDESLYDIK